jgi:hypothetical protein
MLMELIIPPMQADKHTQWMINNASICLPIAHPAAKEKFHDASSSFDRGGRAQWLDVGQ